MALELKGLRKVYAGNGRQPPKEALKGVDLAVPRGSIFGLLGPNGAGKSTLINILAGLVVKSSGTARVFGIDIDVNPRRARRAIGVVPQELNLDAFFTPREALELQAGLYGVPKARAAHRRDPGRRRPPRQGRRLLPLALGRHAAAAARRQGAGPPPAGRHPRRADGRRRRRAAPLASGATCSELNARGVTVVLTTHYLEEAEQMCDRIAIIDRGTVVASDEKDVLLRQLDEKELLLTPAEPCTALPPGLASWDADLDPRGRITVRYRPSRARVGEIIDAVRAAGVTIADLADRARPTSRSCSCG